MGLLFCLCLALSFIEYNLLPPLAIPGVKLGLSNVPIMYAVLFEGASSSVILGVLKSIFVLLTRGGVAGALSFSGGMLSIFGMLLGKRAFEGKGLIALSSVGGLLHSTGQILCAMAILSSGRLIYLAPAIIAFGGVFGAITGAVFKALLPYINNIKKT